MSETRGQDHEAIYVSMHKYVDKLWEEHNRAHVLLGNELERASRANDERMNLANEFRSTLKDQAVSFVTRAEMVTENRALRAQIDQQGKTLNLATGALALLVFAVPIGIALLTR